MEVNIYLQLREAFDETLLWAVCENTGEKRYTQEAWDQLWADKLQENMDKLGLKVTQENN